MVEILKVKHELWQEVTTCLNKMWINTPNEIPIETKQGKILRNVKCEPIPINKVGDYCKGEDSNTTLPVKFNEITSLAILDSGARVAIATKQVWESWGSPAMRKTRMKLQLANGFMESPIGLLEKTIVTSCGIEYEHTFAVVDFGRKPNYEIILGRPFMRQLKNDTRLGLQLYPSPPPTCYHSDALEYVHRCDECQRYKAWIRRDEMPLRPMMGARAFAKWDIDFVGPIDPLAHKMHAHYIIVVTDYVTKWTEAKATQKNDDHTTAKFLYEYIFTTYGLPIEIVSDRGKHFLNKTIEYLLDEFMVIHKKSVPYHPQANGQAKSTNKILGSILTKIVSAKRSDWELKLPAALWAYRVAYKIAIGTTPFNMVYGLDAILPMEFLIPILRVAKSLEWTGHELSERLDELEQLDETRLAAVHGMYALKRRQKKFHDSHITTKEF
ncbi:hypothetical protein L7F22_014166 [Adiantum nelumboides]|nr:hypothetical protein [Adiantum nelumboides]